MRDFQIFMILSEKCNISVLAIKLKVKPFEIKINFVSVGCLKDELVEILR